MGIKFKCPACTKKINVKTYLAGKKGICPHCSARVDIPAESDPGRADDPDEGREAFAAPPGDHIVLSSGSPPAADIADAPFLADLVSHQHPDHDTEEWPAAEKN